MQTHLDELESHISADRPRRRSLKDIFRYILMAFRPMTIILICICLSVMIAVPCLIIVSYNEPSSLCFQISLAVFTGVVASCILSIALEMAANYRRNYLRWIVLHEYLEVISYYEKFVAFSGHGILGADEKAEKKKSDETDIFSAELSDREMAVAEVILEIGPKIEEAYKNGREYMSHREITLCIIVIEACEKLGDLADEVIGRYLKKNTERNDIYDKLEEPFRSELMQFADDAGISIVSDDKLGSVVADYIISNIDEMDDNIKRKLVFCLRSFDRGMRALNRIAAREPEYYENRIPEEQRYKNVERKLKKSSKRADKDTYDQLRKGLEAGKITQSEFDEFYELDEVKELKMPEIDYTVISEEEEDKMMEKLVKDDFDRKRRVAKRKMEIWLKATK